MKNVSRLRLAIALSICVLGIGCADSTTPTDETKVQIYTQMDATTITPYKIKDGNPSIKAKGVTADSMHITRVRVLVSNMKMHMSKEDINYDGHNVKTGPFLVTIDATGQYLFASSQIPYGIYDHIKFEIHKFSNDEVASYINDVVYSDFVTGDRYTVIIDGTVYNAGVAYPYQYKSNVTVNLKLKFDKDLDFILNSTNEIIFAVNPSLIFKSGLSILDPRDPNNSNDIDNGIKSAFHALKK
ncbi:MAG: hypothetical protein JST20_03730 [Bacteroidetes bacterium]|nr:hypothetical protein [Bacteroidota bacterium]